MKIIDALKRGDFHAINRSRNTPISRDGERFDFVKIFAPEYHNLGSAARI